MTGTGRTVTGVDDDGEERVRRANRRLALALALVALAFYLGMLFLRPH